LVSGGNTVLVVEHNTDVLASCDHLIELGPTGGDGGGVIVAEGTPESIASSKTATGRFLAKALKTRSPKLAKRPAKVSNNASNKDSNENSKQVKRPAKKRS